MALDQREDPIGLAVVDEALGAGEDGGVVADHRDGDAVDRAGAGQQAVGRGPFDQVVDLAPPALGGHREAAVLGEAVGVEELLDQGPDRVAPLAATSCDRLGAHMIVQEGAAAEHLGQVGSVEADRCVLLDDVRRRLRAHVGRPGVESGDDGSADDRFTDGDEDLVDRSGLGSFRRMLGLHALEEHDRVAGTHL